MDTSERSLLIKIIESLASTDKKDEEKDIEISEYKKDPVAHIKKLAKRRASLADKRNFEAGNIVIWKEGLKNKRLPNYEQPSIILRSMEPPEVDESDPNSEILDIELGFITEDDEFLVFKYDGSRFELYQK
jgi:hypothetical protein